MILIILPKLNNYNKLKCHYQYLMIDPNYLGHFINDCAKKNIGE